MPKKISNKIVTENEAVTEDISNKDVVIAPEFMENDTEINYTLEDINRLVKMIRISSAQNKTDFAEDLGTTYTAIANFETPGYNMKVDKLVNIVNKKQVKFSNLFKILEDSKSVEARVSMVQIPNIVDTIEKYSKKPLYVKSSNFTGWVLVNTVSKKFIFADGSFTYKNFAGELYTFPDLLLNFITLKKVQDEGSEFTKHICTLEHRTVDALDSIDNTPVFLSTNEIIRDNSGWMIADRDNACFVTVTNRKIAISNTKYLNVNYFDKSLMDTIGQKPLALQDPTPNNMIKIGKSSFALKLYDGKPVYIIPKFKKGNTDGWFFVNYEEKCLINSKGYRLTFGNMVNDQVYAFPSESLERFMFSMFMDSEKDIDSE